MVQYEVTRVPSAQAIDWARIPSVSLEHTQWLAPCPISAQAQLCHDGQDLFVRMEAKEEHIRATLKSPTDQVCEDSCLEFFFAPMAQDLRYFNFEFNPLGNFYIGFGAHRATRSRQLPLDQEQFRIQPFFTEGGWGITYRIPGSFLRLYFPEFRFAGPAACNFYKCGENTVVPHYMCWSPMTCQEPDYHRVQDFGLLTFG